MTYQQVKAAVLNLDQSDQKKLLLEVLAEILPAVCKDDVCLNKIRDFVNEETTRAYREQHMDSI
jgi:hypothetical protein